MAQTAIIRTQATTGGALKNSSGDFLIIFDATLAEQFRESVTITDSPVEKGANISDHVIKNPRGLVMQIVHSNTPLYGGGYPNRDLEAWKYLIELMNTAELLSVVTSREIYENMLIESITDATGEEQAQWITPTITFKPFAFATSKTIDMPPSRVKPIVKNKTPEADAGKQQTKEPTAQTKTQAESLLYQMVH